MTQAHWLRLAESLRGNEPDRYTLPGSIDVAADDNQVHLIRKVGG